jgi:prevent-host-death family protein
MTKVTIRDLRTRFPVVREAVEREGEVVVTDHGVPAFVLRPYATGETARPATIDYYARLRARMPRRLTAAQRQRLDSGDRDER